MKLQKATRKSHPASSRIAEAFMNDSGIRKTQTLKIAKLVDENPGLTASELLQKTSEFDRSQLARRLPDGRQLGYLRNGDLRKSSVTDRMEQTWYAV